ncbi:MAG: tetratricopeptide repeat protein, partial [Acidobacteriota bacterium]
MAERSRRRPYGRVHLSLVVLVLLALGLAVDRISADASASAGNPTPAGVVVEIAQEEYAAHRAGLRPGDVLLRWERAAVPPANPEAAAGILRSPFDLDEVEIEQAPRGPLTLWGTRDGATLKVNLTPQKWKLWTRPAFTPDELAAYERAEALVAQEAHREGFSVWRRMAEAASAAGAPVQAAWLHLRIVDAASKQRDWDVVDRELEQAKHQAEASGEEAVILMARDLLAKSFRDRNDFVRAIARYREVLELRQANAASGLGKAMSLNDLGVVSWYRGDLVESESYFRRALALRERLAPGSRHVADSLNNLAGVARYRGDLAAAEAMYRHSMAIQELLPPTIDFAGCLLNLGNVLSNRGDLVTAERTFRRALAIMEEISPHHPAVAMTLNSLGVLALRRGDLGASEDFHQRALAIKQRLGLEGLSVAASLSSLGNVAMARDELETAGGYLRRALAIWDELAPQSPDVAKSLASLGKLALELGDVDTAERYAQRGFDIVDQLTPMGLATADSLLVLGDIAFARSDLDTTEAHYERALAIRRERVPGSSAIAAACHRLATLHRRSSRPEAALTSYRCAVEALEAQRTKLGGSEEVRAGFGVRYASAYREAIDLLVSMGNTAEAFHLLERYRARELLDLLAERDLVFASDLPAELSRRRRSANKDYDRAFRHWMQLPDHVSAEQQQQARQDLEQARRRQDTIRAEVHAAAPRLAALQDPQPLDLAATRAMLEAGTLLLSYSVGEEQSYLFAVEPDRVEANVVALGVGKAALQAEIERFRTDLERGRIDRRLEKALLPARRLSERLLAPVADQLARADRLLILADGPLHSLP